MEGRNVMQLESLQQKKWHRLIPENIGLEEGARHRPEWGRSEGLSLNRRSSKRKKGTASSLKIVEGGM
jgi:hypothetical protein